MALYANRKDVEPMFGFITKIMMILFSRLKTKITLKCFNFGQFTSAYSVANCRTSLCFFRVVNTIMPRSRTASSFASIRLLIMFLVSFGLILLRVIIIAYFTITAMTGFFRTVFVKFRKWFGFFALGTSFCYDSFRHGFFLHKKLCLEPLQTQYLCGSFYYNNKHSQIKLNLKNFGD